MEQRAPAHIPSDVEAITLDGNGRFLIPKRYIEMADIKQGVRFIGMGDSIEIWSEKNTEKPFMEPDEFGAALESIMTQGGTNYREDTSDKNESQRTGKESGF